MVFGALLDFNDEYPWYRLHTDDITCWYNMELCAHIWGLDPTEQVEYFAYIRRENTTNVVTTPRFLEETQLIDFLRDNYAYSGDVFCCKVKYGYDSEDPKQILEYFADSFYTDENFITTASKKANTVWNTSIYIKGVLYFTATGNTLYESRSICYGTLYWDLNRTGLFDFNENDTVTVPTSIANLEGMCVFTYTDIETLFDGDATFSTHGEYLVVNLGLAFVPVRIVSTGNDWMDKVCLASHIVRLLNITPVLAIFVKNFASTLLIESQNQN